ARFDRIVVAENLEEFRLGGEVEAVVEIGEQTQPIWVFLEFTIHALEIPDNFLCAVGGTIIHHDQAVWTERLARDRLQRLLKKMSTIPGRDRCDDFGFHGPPD